MQNGPQGPGPDGGTPSTGNVVGQLDSGVSTTLPVLPALTNVVATERDDSVGIDFDPVDVAIDYRVYPLPSDQDVTVDADGSVTVANAIYRCAGLRQGYDLPNNLTKGNANLIADNGQFAWTATVGANPTLGYVYFAPAADRLPVYAVAGYTNGSEAGWRESRLKIYTTDAAVRQKLLGQRWRDDGIVFYVPAAASSATHTVYSSQTLQGTAGQAGVQYSQYYFASADLQSHSQDTTPPAAAFQVLNAAADGAQPLMAVFYEEAQSHTELAVGKERFNRAANQGNSPLWHLEWSGLTQPTTLVVEALASGCPYQGFLNTQHIDAVGVHQTWKTLADLKAASTTGEVFVNGQYDATALPKAIARSFVRVAAHPHNQADWDWYQGFPAGADLGTITEVPGCTDYRCDRWKSSAFDISAYRLDVLNGVKFFSYGQLFGQLWLAFDDGDQDLTGKVRFTALQQASVDSDPTKFLHVTMSVNIVSTGRRYPQLIISDQPAPVQEALANPSNNTLLVQTIYGPPMRLEAQAIHGLVGGLPWDVNNQSPEHRFIDYDMDQQAVVTMPTESPFEHAGMDRMTRFDAYVSSQRMYLFMDGTPAGCTTFPSGFALKGSVSITVGDVLYHEGAPDELVCAAPSPFSFMHKHECDETKRHFDDLGFKQSVSAPAWDETKLPCGAY